MFCDRCGKKLQENEMCVCRLPEEKAKLFPLPPWLIPGVICAVIALGYVVLKIAGCNYFLWVYIVWLISAIAFFYLLMRKIKHNRCLFKVVGLIILTVLVFATAGKAFLYIEFLNLDSYIEYVCYSNNIEYSCYNDYIESVSINNNYVFVSDIVDRYYLPELGYVGALAYEYQNSVWYGPLFCRWRDFFDYYMNYEG